MVSLKWHLRDSYSTEQWASWPRWVLFFAAVFAIHLLTVTISPTIWQDEVQIIEFGRVFLNPDTVWSISYRYEQGKPLFYWTYLGPLFQELAYRLTAPSNLGPRVLCILYAIAASTAAYGWIRTQFGAPKLAFLLSALLLLEPLFVQGYRGARVDGLVFALVFSALWLIASKVKSDSTSVSRVRKSTLAGSITAISFFVWPTAIILWPLIFYFLISGSERDSRFFSSFQRRRGVLLGFMSGFLLIFMVLLVPLIPNLDTLAGDAQVALEWGNFGDGAGFVMSLISAAMRMINGFSTPILPVLALLALVLCRLPVLSASLLAVVIVIAQTRVYEHRIVYLLPYIIVLLAILGERIKLSGANVRRLFYGLLTLQLAVSVGMTLLGRPLIALSQSAQRSQGALNLAFEQAIGPGDFKVLLGGFKGWEIYYPARNLGWHVYKVPERSQFKFLAQASDIEFVIFNEAEVSDETRLQLNAQGFQSSYTVGVWPEESDKPLFKLPEILSKVNVLSYGPYTVFSRS